MKRYLLLGALLAVGCGQGSGSVDGVAPQVYEAPYTGIALGADGEIVFLSYEDGTNRQETGVEPATDYYDEPDSGNNGNGNGNGNGNSDVCADFAALGETCGGCLCDNESNPSVCIDDCADYL